jgi:nitrite reductase/ring-hydroxylating ferredoxin subunit
VSFLKRLTFFIADLLTSSTYMDWIKIFDSEEEARQKIHPDKPQLLIVDGVRICLVLHANTFNAVQDACSHNGQSLSKGKVNYLGEIVCPWHGYRFSLNSGRACDSSSTDLKTYSIRSDATGFFIAI